MKISFHGATRGVTGSCHLLHVADKKLLIDCGLYQGGKDLEEENEVEFGFDPTEIDYLLLTHAHLDHCGRVPLLSRRGFSGEIIATSATRELARLIMLDSAGLNEEEARYQTRRSRRRGGRYKQFEPLYTTLDALNSLDNFGRVAQYGKPVNVCPGVEATFLDAGHILGSANIYLRLKEDNRHTTVLFSGDLGNYHRPVLRDPTPPPKADYVVMETTYGDRAHKSLKPSVEELYEAINDTFERGGNVIIPAFALERSQEILYYLREGIEQHRLLRSTQVFLDSPMAISATEIFRRHPECYDEETCELFRQGKDPFGLPGLHYTRQTEDSIAINRIAGGAIIVAGSGMCTGGRVRHHLKHHLWRKDSSIVFVGFAAMGTLGRSLIDGAKVANIFGEKISVNAEIYTIGGFSAHADQAELLNWHRQTGNPKKTFLVHGEEEAMKVFANKLDHKNAVMPEKNQVYEL